MYPYIDKRVNYKEALNLKYPETQSVLEKHPPESSRVSFTFKADGAAKFTNTLSEKKKENVYKKDPNFLNPRKVDGLFRDYSENCTIM